MKPVKPMKHLMRYEGYTSMERVDDILDKISKYGIKSLTQLEKEFLDSHKSGQEEETHDKIAKEESESVFEDDRGYFKFEHTETEDYGDEIHYIGTLYVPDLEWPNGKRLEGRLEGRIVVYSNGTTSPDFYSISKDPKTHEYYDVFEFCNGLEYELDSFIDYVVSELEEKN
jgi:hypothetical protein